MLHSSNKITRTLIPGLLILLSLSFTLIPLNDYYSDFVFRQYLFRDSVIQGAIELILLFSAIVFSIKLLPPKYGSKLIAIISLVLFFTRRHNIDIPIITIALYLNAIFYIGHLSQGKKAILEISAPLGMIYLSAVYLSLSFFSAANPTIIWCIIASINIISFYRRKSNLSIYNKQLYKTAFEWVKNTPLLSSLTITLILFLCAQCNNNPSYDEFWYSLRSHELLNKNGSFFEKIIYPNHLVAYYPKLFETIQYPLLSFKNYAFVKIFSVSIFACILLVFSKITKTFKSPPITLLPIITIPAFANMAIMTKGDIASLLFFSSSLFLFLIHKSKEFTFDKLVLTVLLATAAVFCRMSALPFVFIWISFTTIYFLAKRNYQFNPSYSITLSTFVFLLCFGLLCYRTINIVGVPFVHIDNQINAVKKIYEIFSFDYKYPFDDFKFNVSNKLSTLPLYIGSLFKPTGLRASYNWYSNTYIFFSLLLLFYLPKQSRRNAALSLLVAVFTILTLLIIYKLPFKGGDGNYFIIPSTTITLLSASIILNKNKLKKTYLISTCLFFTMNSFITFITGSNWDPGTERWHLDLHRNPIEGRSNREHYEKRTIRKYALAGINELIPLKKSTYLLGAGPDKDLFSLGRSYLNINQISGSRPQIIQSYKNFVEFIRFCGITHILFPSYPSDQIHMAYFEQLMNEPGVINGKIGAFYYLDLSNFDKPIEKLSNTTPQKKFIRPQRIRWKKQSIDTYDSPRRLQHYNYIKRDKYYQGEIYKISSYANLVSEPFKIGGKSEQLLLRYAVDYTNYKNIGSANVDVRIISIDTGEEQKYDFPLEADTAYTYSIDISSYREGRYSVSLNIENQSFVNHTVFALSSLKLQ